MSSSNFNSPSPVKERRRTLMACMNCRSRKLKCRPLEPVESAPCERCVKEGAICEYRPVEGSASNNNHQDNPVILYPAFAPQPIQESTPAFNSPTYAPPQEGYVPNQIFNPAIQTLMNVHYPPTTPFPQHHAPSYPYQYPNTFPPGYPADQSNYPPSTQFSGGQHQYMAYPPGHGQGNGPWDNQFRGYENMDGSNSTRE